MQCHTQRLVTSGHSRHGEVGISSTQPPGYVRRVYCIHTSAKLAMQEMKRVFEHGQCGFRSIVASICWGQLFKTLSRKFDIHSDCRGLCISHSTRMQIWKRWAVRLKKPTNIWIRDDSHHVSICGHELKNGRIIMKPDFQRMKSFL
jgi:hypothetical protein